MDLTKLIKGTNHCFIVDELGIASTFSLMKSCLTTNLNHHVTIIYYSNDNHFVFKKELVVLERLFPLQFIVFYEMISESTEHLNTDNLEALLNSNVMDDLKFNVSGDEHFNKQICEKLHFLGINKIDIKEILFI